MRLRTIIKLPQARPVGRPPCRSPTSRSIAACGTKPARRDGHHRRLADRPPWHLQNRDPLFRHGRLARSERQHPALDALATSRHTGAAPIAAPTGAVDCRRLRRQHFPASIGQKTRERRRNVRQVVFAPSEQKFLFIFRVIDSNKVRQRLSHRWRYSHNSHRQQGPGGPSSVTIAQR